MIELKEENGEIIELKSSSLTSQEAGNAYYLALKEKEKLIKKLEELNYIIINYEKYKSYSNLEVL